MVMTITRNLNTHIDLQTHVGNVTLTLTFDLLTSRQRMTSDVNLYQV